ncbi:MFS transporter [uncultured Alistipes sp.]|uniref:MFS transporter n=1 Tax=uncultured Alistipes sp. TaxID=538949 RepID=UPI00263201B0|nr:MFS transporter [uncultured Alistipes sp.]
MTETIKRKLSESSAARWTAMLIVSFTMMCGYFITDVMSPLGEMLTRSVADGGLGWSATEYGFFSGAYSWLNIFLFMLLIGGLILDKMGVRFTGIMSCVLMVGGALLKAYAISPLFPADGMLFGFKTQMWMAGLGFAIFGMGAEICGITVSKVIVKWFTGHELALALGLQVAMARLGTAVALFFSPHIAQATGNISYPVLFGALALCIGLLAYLVYCVMDKRLDNSIAAVQTEKEEGFKLGDIKFIVTNKGFWLIALLCLMFYSGVFPFLKFAAQLMIYKYGVDPVMAGAIPSILPFGTILLTPLFGSIYDHVGKGATLMIIGAVMLVVVHVLFALPIFNEWWFALIIMIVLGVAFSLVPSAMWPSVPKIIPQKQLGSAYALIFYVQNIGLMCVPMLIGWVVDRYSKFTTPDGTVSYDYTLPMTIFALFGVVAVGLALWLKAEDHKKRYGLEEANIRK